MRSKEAMARTLAHQAHRGSFFGCWEWTGSTVSSGHGQTRFIGDSCPCCGGPGPKVQGLVHRLVWEAFNGPIPEGLVVRHTCDNPKCFRIDHLLLGSQQENVLDAVRRGRWSQTKLSDADVKEIRSILETRGPTSYRGQRQTPSNRSIARRYNVSPVIIDRIASGKRSAIS